jgi:hypothetical protein
MKPFSVAHQVWINKTVPTGTKCISLLAFSTSKSKALCWLPASLLLRIAGTNVLELVQKSSHLLLDLCHLYGDAGRLIAADTWSKSVSQACYQSMNKVLHNSRPNYIREQ